MYLTIGEKQYQLEISAGYVTTADSSAYMINLGGKQEFAKWLREICGRSDFTTNVMELKISDWIVTLSTCAFNFEEARYVINGRLKEIMY